MANPNYTLKPHTNGKKSGYLILSNGKGINGNRIYSKEEAEKLADTLRRLFE